MTKLLHPRDWVYIVARDGVLISITMAHGYRHWLWLVRWGWLRRARPNLPTADEVRGILKD